MTKPNIIEIPYFFCSSTKFMEKIFFKKQNNLINYFLIDDFIENEFKLYKKILTEILKEEGYPNPIVLITTTKKTYDDIRHTLLIKIDENEDKMKNINYNIIKNFKEELKNCTLKSINSIKITNIYYELICDYFYIKEKNNLKILENETSDNLKILENETKVYEEIFKEILIENGYKNVNIKLNIENEDLLFHSILITFD